jgi:hypothetical protein
MKRMRKREEVEEKKPFHYLFMHKFAIGKGRVSVLPLKK